MLFDPNRGAPHSIGQWFNTSAFVTNAAQIPEFVKSGSVMFLDWPFHIDMNQVRREAEGEAPAAERGAVLEAIWLYGKEVGRLDGDTGKGSGRKKKRAGSAGRVSSRSGIEALLEEWDMAPM